MTHHCELFVVEVLYSDETWHHVATTGSGGDARHVVRELLSEDRRLRRIDLRVVRFAVGKKPRVL